MTPGPLAAPWEEAERWARVVIAISGAGLVVWAFVRWPLAVLLKAAALAAVKSALRDEEARESLSRVLRQQLLKPEVDRLVAIAESFEQLEHRVNVLEVHDEAQASAHLPRRSSRR